jgi:ribosomal-protein-alanine N-acetyltransferase
MINLSSELQIDQFRPSDMAQVVELEQLCFKDPYPWWLLSELAHRNPETFVIAKVNDRIVGYAIIDHWEDHYHLVSIAVHPGNRRTGIATGLLNGLDKYLTRNITVKLEVRESNDPAIAFYLKHGFAKVDVIPDYYADGENAIVMEKLTGETKL